MHKPTAENTNPKKKLLENPVVGSLVVPIAIVLVGALLVFGVTRMLSSERSYRDLVREMQSKTFGNRWVAALELSQLISSSSIPEEDLPWLIGQLASIYESSQDTRTRNFIVVALGSLKNELALPVIIHALGDADAGVKFRAIVALGDMDKRAKVSWEKVLPFLESEDHALQQASVLALATHRVLEAEEGIVGLLANSSQSMRYSAAIALINYKNEKAIPTLKEVLLLSPSDNLNLKQVSALKINTLSALQKNDWLIMQQTIEQVADQERDVQVVSHARELLNKLKN